MLITLFIISILAVASYYVSRASSREAVTKSAETQLLNVLGVQRALLTERGSYTDDINVLESKLGSISFSNTSSKSAGEVYVSVSDGMLVMSLLTEGGLCVTLSSSGMLDDSFGAYVIDEDGLCAG